MEEDPTSAHDCLSFNQVLMAGPPARPLEFPAPTVFRGHRITTDVYEPRSKEVVRVKNVLYRDPSTSDRRLRNVPATGKKCAYLIRKKIADAVYGSIRICAVLKRCDLERRNEIDKIGAVKRRSQEKENFSDFGSLKTANSSSTICSCEEDEETKRMRTVLWEVTEEFVVVKLVSWSKVRNMRGRHLEDPLKEVSAMQLLGDYHPHVLGVLDVLQDDQYLYSIMPYCRSGDLFGKITEEIQRNNSPGGVKESKAKHWFRQILLGLHHLQKKGVCHRDICLENIMVDKKNCMIIDMGMCLRVPYSDPSNECCVTDASAGTLRRLIKAQGQGGKWLYMAPEVVAREETFDGFAIDLWAAGVILYIMLVGLAPFKRAHESDKRFKVFSSGGLVETLIHYNINLSPEAGRLLQDMFWRDPSRRLSLAQVMEHPWFKN
mmetsp:Transcript_23851/g.34881  ORF Transcript_23851/g.34881 Transcript_23851/m.34881 type:complete len:433 (-) Transcript_23851:396-1694(-)|eukprot:CAMPEP_0195523008 /NCGR_PEP_ID=MMETSP0794_2-20130614/21740_1 /TAXON_ID=515487 /ORGANISM="Stephanopyxis turris, Strain CCMP 815" /LENGTH=432 /DNA_ID=CAMNT_0040652907 /DNA_START=243 /DNA_END=1541 /DNA_ORIENTATION=-